MIVKENITFKRGQDSKKSLDLGFMHLVNKDLTSDMLGALLTYRDHGYKKLNWFEDQNGHRITKNGVNFIVRIAPFLEDIVFFGGFHYGGDDDQSLYKETQEEGYQGMHPYYAFIEAQDGHFVAYSKIPLPAANELDPDDFDY